MNLNDAPRTAIAPDGTTHEPVRVLVTDDKLTVEDRDGVVLATAEVLSVSAGSRITTIETTDGRWVSRSICSCGSHRRSLLRQWYG